MNLPRRRKLKLLNFMHLCKSEELVELAHI